MHVDLLENVEKWSKSDPGLESITSKAKKGQVAKICILHAGFQVVYFLDYFCHKNENVIGRRSSATVGSRRPRKNEATLVSCLIVLEEEVTKNRPKVMKSHHHEQ